MFNILTRAITEDEAHLLTDRIKLTPNIVGYSSQEWIQAKHVVVAESEDGTLVGACLNYDFHEQWRKIAALIVFVEFRGQGIGKKLFLESFYQAVQDGKNVYTISANPIVLNMMSDLGFEKFNNFTEFLVENAAYRVLFLAHTIKWLASWYRLQEIVRKFFVYRQGKSFVLGIKALQT